MSEGSEHSHHAASKSDMSAFVLPLSILLAAVIVGFAMMSAATTVNNGFMEFAKNAGTLAPAGTGDTVVPTPDEGNLAPVPSKTMAELASENYAAKLGSDSAPIVMVEYSDGQCPFCRRFALQTFPEIVQNYVNTGKVQIIYKDFPLSFHPMAPTYANAMRCAGEQNKFWEMKKTIFDKQQAIDPSGGTVSTVTVDNVKSWAKELGLNESAFNTCVDAMKYNTQVSATMAEGSAMGVSGTPSFIVGKRAEKGQLIVGAQPTAVFTAAIDGLSA